MNVQDFVDFGHRPRVLVVGELNPFGADPKFALFHRPRQSSGNRLRCILGLNDFQYMKMLDKVNLCTGRWSQSSAGESASEILDKLELCKYEVVILLGAKVRKAFGKAAPTKFFSSRSLPLSEVKMVSIPHPSGRCRVWNEANSWKRARDVVKGVAPWLPIGDDCNV